MKKLLLILFAVCLSLTKNYAQVNVQDSLALIDLYNSTNGLNWLDNTNWLSANPVNTWFGITVEENRVISIHFDENEMHGPLPASIGNLSGLQTLWIVTNSISGSIPESIGNLTSLRTLNLTESQITGIIPESISNLTNLEVLAIGRFSIFSTSGLTGAIPASIGNLTNLKILALSDNRLEGTIPASIGNLTKLVKLDLSGPGYSDNGNELTGPIPNSIGNLVNLRDLELYGNKLNGAIPVELCNISSSLQYLNIQFNQFTFEGIECIGTSAALHPFFDQSYSFQSVIPVTNNNPVLSVSAGGTLSNNTYKWYKKDNIGDPDPTAPILEKTGDSTLQLPGPGIYWAEVRNSIATQLTLLTERITIESILPLQWLGFTAQECSGNICLQWQTDNEQNTDHFEIERSKDGRKFERINAQPAYNTAGKHVYNTADFTAGYGTNYYRVKQVDKDGRYSYSIVQTVKIETAGVVMIAPNPARSFIQVKGIQQAERVTLYSITGQRLMEWQHINKDVWMNIGSLQKGVYIIKVLQNNKETVHKLLKQ